ncbi:MAG: excinuclease ABC subunit UvrC [Gammaproteobacteria bacterium]|nr:excinuclease ABC subunit UvrC [Gammaproteobacteria bacterium]
MKKRVSSYFGSKAHHPKTQALMNAAQGVDFTVTNTELEALILEYNLIKLHQPRFNVLLRDDKSYPYIHFTGDHEYPRVVFFRGARKKQGRYFGPYPNSWAVREALLLIQKLFGIRQCDNSFFENRSRPCLQFQIKRCSGPCTGEISPENYAESVKHATLFLEGRSEAVVNLLQEKMNDASNEQRYELAGTVRDQIAAIKQLQSSQLVSGNLKTSADAVAVVEQAGQFAICCIMIRGGRVLGSRKFFPKTAKGTTAVEVMSGFLGLHYFSHEVPPEILLNVAVPDMELLSAGLSNQTARKVILKHRLRGRRHGWIDMASTNAKEALMMRLASNASLRSQREELAQAFGLDELPLRIECFDISHTSGEATVASCVVFGVDGPMKQSYRRFNIKDVAPGDDYAAIHQAVKRRYKRVKAGESAVPDLVFIDGGKGQLASAVAALEEVEMQGLTIAGISKGVDRRAGDEQIWLPGESRSLPIVGNSGAMHLIQKVRDEAHRFAVAGHRASRNKARNVSPLEAIEGLGPKRRKALLQHFGGLQGVKSAGKQDLARVNGISVALAEKIYGHFHGVIDAELK